MNDPELLDRVLTGMREWNRSMAQCRAARLLEPPGVTAAVVPATPERSVLNSVVYERPRDLAAALEELAAAYEQAGIRAWTVWVPPFDRDSAALLERAGHALDAEPLAMAMELDRFEAPAGPSLEIECGWEVEALCRLNDLAYPREGNSFGPALRDLPSDGARIYLARIEGEEASTLMVRHVGDDCRIEWVATRPDARGRGLATALLAQALLDSRERGSTTSTLEATRAGAPIYRRLGYRPLGALQMWERRSP